MVSIIYPEVKFKKPVLIDILSKLTHTNYNVHWHKPKEKIFDEIILQDIEKRREHISEYEEKVLERKFGRTEPLPKYMNKAQFEILLRFIRTYKKKAFERYEGMVLFAKGTGARPGEICNAKVKDIDLTQFTFRVDKTKQKKQHIYRILDHECRNYLKRYLMNKKQDDPLFLSNWNKPYTVKGFSKVIRTLATKAGIKVENGKSVISAHKMRHTHGVIAAEEKVPQNAIQAQLGHSNPNTTAIYTAIAGEEIETAYGMNRIIDKNQSVNPKRKEIKYCIHCGFNELPRTANICSECGAKQ